ncbi:MAG: precorrin-2 C(20)-methyltransferase [Deltaproteobacteria bacterium]|nr:precorrin-2 C(20)-methyltransferase [Deltaproteobacteria bacterium]
MSTQPGKLYGVGVGPGDPQLLTVKAVNIFRKVQVIFDIAGPNSQESVSGNILKGLSDCHARRERLLFSMSGSMASRTACWEKAAERVMEVLSRGENAAVATIGDPLIYSTFGYLRRQILLKMPQADIEVIPGITSFQAAAALRGEPLVENREILTIIPALENSHSNQEALRNSDTAVLLKTYRNRDDKVRQVMETMIPESIFYAARIGHLDMVMATDPLAISALPPDYLSLLIAKKGPHA